MIKRLWPAYLLVLAIGCAALHEQHEHEHGHEHGHEHAHGAEHGHGHDGHTHGPRETSSAPARVDLGRIRNDSRSAARTLRAPIERAMHDHDFPRVVRLVRAYRAKRPTDLWANLIASDALVELGRLAEAERELQGVLDVKPSGASYLRAGYLLHLSGDTPGGLEVLALALEAGEGNEPVRVFAHIERGDLLWFTGKLAGAEASYAAALRLDRRAGRARVGLARVAAARGELHRAAQQLKPAANTPALLGELATIYRALDQGAAARRALAKARRMTDRDPEHWARSYAVCLADLHMLGSRVETRRAVRLARRELKRRGGAHGWDALGWALLADGQPTAALAAAERALAAGIEEPLLLFHAGMAAARAGQASKAKTWLSRALQLNPNFHLRFPGVARKTLETLTKDKEA